MLLVDSEAPVALQHRQGEPGTWRPWLHLGNREGDGWQKPAKADETDCHLMVQVMESWFLADRASLKAYFGQDFKENQLPARGNALEGIPKQSVHDSLANATQGCNSKGTYGKGPHSFELLALIDPAKVQEQSPWAKRFVEETKKKMGVTS